MKSMKLLSEFTCHLSHYKLYELLPPAELTNSAV